MPGHNRIEIVGCTASGKSTLCKTLTKLGLDAVYEPYAQNPFIRSFYSGEKCEFELQMCFLLQHYRAIRERDPDSRTVCDFSLMLDTIYAAILLNEEENEVYTRVYTYLISQIGPPRCVIRLTCPDDEIFARIKKRGRDYEQGVDSAFIKALNEKVRTLTVTMPCIEIDSSKVNISDPEEVNKYLYPYCQ